jgi:hypothetical protein
VNEIGWPALARCYDALGLNMSIKSAGRFNREKRVNLIEGSLQIARLLLSNDQAYRSGLTSFLDLASGVVLLGIFHVFS